MGATTHPGGASGAAPAVTVADTASAAAHDPAPPAPSISTARLELTRLTQAEDVCLLRSQGAASFQVQVRSAGRNLGAARGELLSAFEASYPWFRKFRSPLFPRSGYSIPAAVAGELLVELERFKSEPVERGLASLAKTGRGPAVKVASPLSWEQHEPHDDSAVALLDSIVPNLPVDAATVQLLVSGPATAAQSSPIPKSSRHINLGKPAQPPLYLSDAADENELNAVVAKLGRGTAIDSVLMKVLVGRLAQAGVRGGGVRQEENVISYLGTREEVFEILPMLASTWNAMVNAPPESWRSEVERAEENLALWELLALACSEPEGPEDHLLTLGLHATTGRAQEAFGQDFEIRRPHAYETGPLVGTDRSARD